MANGLVYVNISLHIVYIYSVCVRERVKFGIEQQPIQLAL